MSKRNTPLFANLEFNFQWFFLFVRIGSYPSCERYKTHDLHNTVSVNGRVRSVGAFSTTFSFVICAVSFKHLLFGKFFSVLMCVSVVTTVP